FSPLRAKNRHPGSILRLSVQILGCFRYSWYRFSIVMLGELITKLVHSIKYRVSGIKNFQAGRGLCVTIWGETSTYLWCGPPPAPSKRGIDCVSPPRGGYAADHRLYLHAHIYDQFHSLAGS